MNRTNVLAAVLIAAVASLLSGCQSAGVKQALAQSTKLESEIRKMSSDSKETTAVLLAGIEQNASVLAERLSMTPDKGLRFRCRYKALGRDPAGAMYTAPDQLGIERPVLEESDIDLTWTSFHEITGGANVERMKIALGIIAEPHDGTNDVYANRPFEAVRIELDGLQSGGLTQSPDAIAALRNAANREKEIALAGIAGVYKIELDGRERRLQIVLDGTAALVDRGIEVLGKVAEFKPAGAGLKALSLLIERGDGVEPITVDATPVDDSGGP